jgi:hypothetical protein
MLSDSARFGGIEHRRLPGRHDAPDPRTDAAGLIGTIWPETSQSQVTDRGEPLLDARRRERARARLDPGGNVTCTGWTERMDGTSALAHQAENSSAARA